MLYRSDTKAPLSVVSQRYHTVQPRDVLEFYRDLTEVSGYELETAGVLKGGRKFWALARTGQGAALKDNDQVNGYLLLATSCDGTLATTATPTTIRVVCNNTLTIALDSVYSSVVSTILKILIPGWSRLTQTHLISSKLSQHQIMKRKQKTYRYVDWLIQCNKMKKS